MFWSTVSFILKFLAADICIPFRLRKKSVQDECHGRHVSLPNSVRYQKSKTQRPVLLIYTIYYSSSILRKVNGLFDPNTIPFCFLFFQTRCYITCTDWTCQGSNFWLSGHGTIQLVAPQKTLVCFAILPVMWIFKIGKKNINYNYKLQIY